MTDYYANFAPDYDLFFKTRGVHPPGYSRFFARTFAKYNTRTVLDCACGTGRDLVLFNSLGVKVQGSDISPAMLQTAQQNIEAEGLDIPLRKGDFCNLPSLFQKKFDAITCLSTSLPHVKSRRDALSALKSMFAVLRDGGVVILSQGLTDKMVANKTRFIPVLDTPETTRLFALDYKTDKVVFNVLDLKRHQNNDKTTNHPLPELAINSFEYLLLLHDDYKTLLNEAGFRDIRYYGNYDKTRYNKETSDRLIITAVK